MKVYTFAGCALQVGVALSSDANGDPVVSLGESGRGRKLVLAPLPPGATIEGRVRGRKCPHAGPAGQDVPVGVSTPACPACGGIMLPRHPHEGWLVKPAEGRLTEVLPRTPDDRDACVLVIRDHSGFRGGWSLRGARPAGEWDDIVRDTRGLDHSRERADWNAAHPERPHGCRMVADGRKGQGDAGYAGGGPEYLLVVPAGAAIEIVRAGRLYDTPSCLRLDNIGGSLILSDPRKDAEARLAAASW